SSLPGHDFDDIPEDLEDAAGGLTGAPTGFPAAAAAPAMTGTPTFYPAAAPAAPAAMTGAPTGMPAAAPASTHTPRPDSEVRGKTRIGLYEVISEIGHGGMG